MLLLLLLENFRILILHLSSIKMLLHGTFLSIFKSKSVIWLYILNF